MNEIGNMTKAIEGDKDKECPRARVTVVLEFDLDSKNYRYDSANDRDLSEDEIKALTPEQMLEMEKNNLVDGIYGIDELLDDLDYADEKQVKWEVISE